MSYRRHDTEADANALYQTLSARFGEESLFKDVDDVPLGSNFREILAAAIERADVVLVLIGPDWLRRPGEPVTLLERDGDVVRIEIESALSLGVPLIPILVRGAVMPRTEELPDSLAVLSDINGAYVEHRSWSRDLVPVITAIEHQLDIRASARRRDAIARVASARDAVERRDWDAAEDALSLLRGSEGIDAAEVESLAGEIERGRTREARRRKIEDLAADTDHQIGAGHWAAARALLAELRQEGAEADLIADLRRRVIGGQEAERRSATAAGTDAPAAAPAEPSHPRSEPLPSPSLDEAPHAGSARSSTLDARISSLAAEVYERRQARPGRQALSPFASTSEPARSSDAASSARGWRRRARIVPSVALASVVVVFLVLAFGGFFDFGPDSGAGSTAESSPTVFETIDVGESPRTPAVADGKIWVPSFSPSADLTVVDPIGNDVITSVKVADGVTSRHQLTPAVTEGLLWVPLWGNLTINDGSVGVVNTQTNAIVATIHVGGLPETPAVAGDKIWVPRARFGQVAVVDVAHQEVITHILAAIGQAEGIWGVEGRTPAVAQGKVWIPDQEAEAVVAVDAATNQIVAAVTVGQAPATPAVAGGRIWVPNTGGRTLTVIDATTNEIVGNVRVGEGPRTPAVADGTIWVPDHGSNTVTVVDADAMSVLTTVAVGTGPVTPAVAEGKVWVPNSRDDTVTVIDAATNAVVATVTVGPSPGTPAVANGKVWVPNTGSSTLSVIDAVTNEVVRRADEQPET